MGSNIDLGAYEFCHLTTTPTVSISSSPSTTVPANTTVLFTATISNGGTNPKIEWWKNSHQIPGANMLTYSAIAGSDFMDGDTIWAKISSSEPCAQPDTATSNKAIMSVITSLNSLNLSFSDFQIFPNPNKGNFIVKGGFEENTIYEFHISDIFGRKVIQGSLKASKGQAQINSQKELAPAIYFLTLFKGNQYGQTIRFVVE